MNYRPLVAFVTSVAGLSAYLLISSVAANATATIIIEQKSDVEANGTWTVTMPNQVTATRSDAQTTMEDSLPGRYTVFAKPPSGTLTTIKLYESGALIQTVEHPQISFNAGENSIVRVSISYILTNFGKVGVNSYPDGISFYLKGPDAYHRAGVTPATFERVPVGAYSVQYQPSGCPDPPAKSDVLEKDTSIYFSITLKCATFRPKESGDTETNVKVELDGEVVTFTDVLKDTWYGPYVATVASRGILTGYRDALGNLTGEFGPDQPVLLAELSKIAHELAGIDPNAVSAAPINPQASGQWFTKYIASAEQRGWLMYQKQDENLLRPATRGEVLVTVLQALDIPMQWAKGTMFTDVSPRTPYASAIETAAAVKLVSGSTDADGKPTGLFHPDQHVTRAEMAKILIIAHEKYIKRPTVEE